MSENGAVLGGTDLDYGQQIARFRKVHTRVSLKAGAPEDFTKKTGARPESFDLPFQGIENLIKAGGSIKRTTIAHSGLSLRSPIKLPPGSHRSGYGVGGWLLFGVVDGKRNYH